MDSHTSRRDRTISALIHVRAVLAFDGMLSGSPAAASHAFDLAAAAVAEMAHNGFDLTPVPGMPEQLAAIHNSPDASQALSEAADLLTLPWSSIDNDTSRDLDQIEWAEPMDGGAIRVRIGIADVAATVAKDTPLDQFAGRQTQTVYTAQQNFPMLPLDLSTGLTSLNPGEDRLALVAEYIVGADGTLSGQRIFSAKVRNQAQLTYSRVGPWLASGASDSSFSGDLPAQLRLQDEAAQRLRRARKEAGALDFRRTESTPVVRSGKVVSLEDLAANRAMDMIEDLMIGANETVALALSAAHRSSLRRVVRSPERWERIVELIRQRSAHLPSPVELPAQPDAKALNNYLTGERVRDPDGYPDLSLAIIKLMGAGEYVLARGDDPDPPSHFALAAHDYAHSTAPNRRFADLVAQRLVHAMLRNQPAPYSDEELQAIAAHCNERDAAARKVERAMLKRAQAVALGNSIGQHYRAIVTGAGLKGTFVRVLQPAVEGMLVGGAGGLDVGDRVNVRLVHTDPERAFIDFARTD